VPGRVSAVTQDPTHPLHPRYPGRGYLNISVAGARSSASAATG